MKFRAAGQRANQAAAIAQGNIIQLGINLAPRIETMKNGDVSGRFALDLQAMLQSSVSQLNRLRQVPGVGRAFKALAEDQSYDGAAALVAAVATIEDILSVIATVTPQPDDVFTPEQTVGMRVKLTAVLEAYTTS